MRIALVHDWLTGMRGGEKCLEVFSELLPEAPILTLFHEPGSTSRWIESRRIVASGLSRFALLRRHYRRLLPFYRLGLSTLDTGDFDLVISLSHCVAKGIAVAGHTRHLCYCFTPARYLWDLQETYLARSPLWQRLAAQAFLPDLRSWDRATAANVDEFVAISHYIAQRIARIYQRQAAVIYPPVDSDQFSIGAPSQVEDYYLMVTALAPYKGVALAIEACQRSGRRLVVIGKGPEEARLRRLAGPQVEFRGWCSDSEVAHAYQRCRAFILPCDEDFGITPLEAMASGRPVIALGKGGALETVPTEQAGCVLFEELEVESLRHAIGVCEGEQRDVDAQALRQHSQRFDKALFRSQVRDWLLRSGVPESALG